MKRTKKVAGILTGAAMAIAGFGYYLSNRVMYIKKKDEDFIYKREVAAKRLSPVDFAALPKEDIWVRSPFGYSLKAQFIRPYPASKKYMIFCHGVTENKTNAIKYMNIFLERGFNAVIYDHRRHGQSGGKTSSYGFYEKHDLKAIVDYLLFREGNELFFGIHGESMGAATTLLYAGSVEDRANFYIVDCPFSDFRSLLAYRFTKEIKLPGKWFVPLADLFIRMRDGYSLDSVSPLAVIEEIQKPILFIHSEKDDFILPEMTKELYDRKKGSKSLFMAKNGLHAQSLNENREAYEKAVDDFLEEIVETK
ncbi:fermentation-respiration switch protein FrsA (DUF1100 family) [Bacillus chungangensis]|uniref:Fermentation-respiration switch protein FrsA (DUF1100 family) n=2 Tax=Bacillus chungangensis TaxID=587633 RepID=A0ABT9WP64_9BACI|nr:fermentation-respiration switch protein FrsA (DUF1100 family) [Bacillus chungangensis]